MIDFERARAQMVESQLRAGGVHDARILASMRTVPREIFVPETRRDLAYADATHWYGEAAPGRFMPAPAILARLLKLADINAGDSVLDVGAATGYATSVIAGLAAGVTGLEQDAGLAATASANLAGLGLDNARMVAGGIEQVKGVGFDVIILQGTLDRVPDAFIAALNEGGRLVALISAGAVATARLLVKSDGRVTARTDFNAALPPLFASRADVQFVF